ncbi:MAG: sigma-70 family RNA polymerase sigma factor [Pseudomonadota bacterium]
MGYENLPEHDKNAARTSAEPAAGASVIPKRVLDLYGEYAGELASAIRRMYGDGPPDPDDVAQEAFQRVIERGDVTSIRNLKAFVWRTARNLILTENHAVKRRAARESDVQHYFYPAEGDDSTPEKIISAREQLNAINSLLRTMPEKRRRAFILHRLEGLSVAEVGRRLGIGRTAAAKHVSRAAAELNALFVDDSEY